METGANGDSTAYCIEPPHRAVPVSLVSPSGIEPETL